MADLKGEGRTKGNRNEGSGGKKMQGRKGEVKAVVPLPNVGSGSTPLFISIVVTVIILGVQSARLAAG